MTLRMGLAIPQMGPYVDRALVVDVCQQAEEMGFASLWVAERLFRPLGTHADYAGPTSKYVKRGSGMPVRQGRTLSSLELLAVAAAVTKTVRIGTSVLIMGIHWPIELAQRLATLDVLSEGRLDVGLGVGWSSQEFEAMGTDPQSRGRRADDFVLALLHCWGPDPVQYEGPVFHIPQSEVGPKPLQQPRPPLYFGMWSKPGLARTVRWADGWNSAGGMTVPEAHAVWESLVAQRPGRPLRLIHRQHVQSPVEDRPRSMEVLLGIVHDALMYGVHELIIDPNLSSDIRSAQDWIREVERYGELLAASGSSAVDGSRPESGGRVEMPPRKR